jgi:hypothetical protein
LSPPSDRDTEWNDEMEEACAWPERGIPLGEYVLVPIGDRESVTRWDNDTSLGMRVKWEEDVVDTDLSEEYDGFLGGKEGATFGRGTKGASSRTIKGVCVRPTNEGETGVCSWFGWSGGLWYVGSSSMTQSLRSIRDTCGLCNDAFKAAWEGVDGVGGPLVLWKVSSPA